MKKILIITPVYDEAMLDGLNLRIVNIVKALSEKYKVNILCFSEPKFNGFVKFNNIEKVKLSSTNIRKLRLLLLGKTTYHLYTQEAFISQLKKMEQEYDAFFAFYISAALPLLKLKTYKPIFVDLVDCLYLHMKEAKTVSCFRQLYYKMIYKKVRRTEINCIRSCKLSYITSSVEKKALVDYCPEIEKKICVISNGVKLRDNLSDINELSYAIGFLGRMDYYPNIIAAERLVKKILPKTKLRMHCYIIGAVPAKEVLALQSGMVTITGYVDDVQDILSKIDFIVLPMETASGVQNKLITCLASGKAVVTTKRVDTGTFDFIDGNNIIFAESDNDYVNKIENLYSNSDKIKIIGDNAYKLMQNNTWTNVLTPLLNSMDQ